MFGTPKVLADGHAVSLPYRKADALLYYLIRKRRAARSELIGLLWADTDTQTAQKNLRHAIYSIRKELGWDPFASGHRAILELSPEVEIRCDVSDFLESGDPELYGGEFLKGFAIPLAEGFEDWLVGERTALQTRYLRKLLEAGEAALNQEDLEKAERFSLAYLTVDPLEESAVMLLMRVCRARQQFRRAIGIYHDLSQSLADEFGVSPLNETTALYYQIADLWNASAAPPEEMEEEELLVGKDQALRDLAALASTSRVRHSPCLLLSGEAGVGKTYLLDHFLAHCDLSGWLICRSFCYQTEMGSSLSAWNSIALNLAAELELRHISIPENYLRTAAALFPSLAPGSAVRLTDLDQDYPLQSDYHTAQHSMLTIFSMVARQIPLLLIFEDIHWMDRSSMDFLFLLLRQLKKQNAAVICTSRDLLPPHMERFVEEGLRDKVLKRCTVPCFSRDETEQFLRRYTAWDLRKDLVDHVYQSTSGNALLLNQLADVIAEKGALASAAQIPEDIIAYRLSALSQDEWQVLELISVFICWAPFEALSSILRIDTLELTYLCHQLTQKKFLAESLHGTALEYCFIHETIKASVSRRQSESGLRLLHLQVANYLESRTDDSPAASYDQLIHHYSAGGDRFKAFQYRILSLSAYIGLRYELLPTLTGESKSGLSRTDELLDYFQTMETELAELYHVSSALGRAELDRLELMLLHTESRCHIHDGRYEKGLKVLERLLERCGRLENRGMAVQAHLQFIYYGIQTGNLQVMKEHLELVRQLLLGAEHTADFGVYLRLSGLLELMNARYHHARTILRRSISVFQSLDPDMDGRYAINIAGVYNYIAESYRLEQNYVRAFQNYDQAIVYNRSRGYYSGAALFYTNYGVAAYQSGQPEEALKLFRYAEDIYKDSHEYSEYPIALSFLALYDAQDGRFVQAAERLRSALRVCDAIGSPQWKGVTLWVSWKIRCLITRRRQTCPELESIWPASEAEHCVWCLSFLRQLQPRLETEEMEREYLRVTNKGDV